MSIEVTPTLVLGIDAATPPATVAVVRGEQLLSQEAGPFGRGTDAWILDAIDRALRAASAELGDLDGIGVSAGPGTFTGVRVGLATAAGLGVGSTTPVAGIGTLEALIESALEATGRKPDSLLLACIDARRGELYAALGRPEAWPAAPLELDWGPKLLSPDELVERLSGIDRLPAIGTGVELDARLGELIERIDEAPAVAVSVARLAARTLQRDPSAALPPPLPVYLRAPDARPGRSPLDR